MAWEALNNIAAEPDLPLVIVVNDNERSYAPTRGGLADHLATLRTTRGYERFLDWGKHTLARTPVVGGAMYETLHGVKKGIKDIVAPQGLFEDLGLKYLGPVDGHDEQAIETALRKARAFGGPVLVHVLTQKGRGYDPAITDEADQFHAVGVINPETGLPLEIAGRSWTDEFSDEMVRIGARPPGRRRDHRRDDDPGRAQGLLRALPRAHLRRRHRRAARAHHGGRPGVHRAAPRRRRLRDLPQPRVRPAAHGLRHAQGRRHGRARPLRHHRPRRRLAPRHVGHDDQRRRARAAPRRPA